jgi:diguanylate cyclase (GGDEF)-like protein
MEAYAASTGAAVVTCAALCALVLAERFLARGGGRLLLLACALSFSALAFAGATLVDVPAPESTWLWALAHGGLVAGLAAGSWGGSRTLRRRLADPALDRARTLARALAATMLATGAAVAALALASPPDVPVACLAGAVAAASLAALVVVVRRGRRGDVERRLPLLAAAVPAAALLELAGEPARYALRAVDVVAMAALTAALVHDLGLERRRLGAVAAAEDPLTGAHTRTAALLAAAELHRSRSPREPLAIALVGLDGLGSVNQAYGQLAGDAVLQAVAGLLRGALREEDIVGRFGGDAFVAILPGTAEQGAALALNRALDAVREAQLGTWARPLQLTASAGLALVGAGERAVDAALVAADRALGDAQHAGGDRLVSATTARPARAPAATRRRAGAGPRAA